MRFLFILLFSILIHPIFGQLELKWANQIETISTELLIDTDGEGNLYSIDYFSFDFDVDPGSGSTILIDNDYQYYIQKLDSNGQFIWGYSFLDTGVTLISDIFVTENGEIYLTGGNYGTTDFAPGNLTFFQSDTSYSSFVLKLDSDANFQWVKSFPSLIGYAPWDMNVFVDENNSVYLSAVFSDSTILDISVDTILLVNNGTQQTTPGIIKLDSSGNYINHVSFKNNSYCNFKSLQVRNDKIYITGEFSNSFDFNPGIGNSILSSPFNSAFLLKLDTAFNFQWVKPTHGSAYTRGTSLAVDNNENIYTVGEYRGQTVFDPGFQNITFNGNGTDKLFVQKIDSAGNFNWVKVFGDSTYFCRAYSIETDSLGSFYLCGYFNGTYDFNSDPNLFHYLNSANGYTYILSYDTVGNFRFARNFKAFSYTRHNNFAITKEGSIYLSGDFFMTFDADLGEDIYLLQVPTGHDRFTLKINQCDNYIVNSVSDTICSNDGYNFGSIQPVVSGYYSEIFNANNGCDSIVNLTLTINDFDELNTNQTICNGEQIIFGSLTLTNTGNYTQVFNNKIGCDSIVHLYLTVTNPNTNITIQSDGGLSCTGASSHLWFDCNLGFSSPLASGNLFYPPYLGSFAVVSTLGNCSDTSDCLIYNSIEEKKQLVEINISPNPFTENFEISELPHTDLIFELMNPEGEIIWKKYSTDADKILMYEENLPNGIYFLKIESETMRAIKKVIKIN